MSETVRKSISVTPSVRLVDMHAHPYAPQSVTLARRELDFRRREGIFTLYCAKNPPEWELFKRLGCGPVGELSLLSFGIHPWECASFAPSDFPRLYEEAPVIGEIGLDNVWTELPPELQRRVFIEQLELAERLRKPVIIHVKGCEAEMAELLRDFSCPVLIHWYSGDTVSLDRLIGLGCYFTLGPDAPLGEGELTRAMLGRIPRERLLTETDGLESILWAMEQRPPLRELLGNNAPSAPELSLIPASLRATLQFLADYDCVDPESTRLQTISVMKEFIAACPGRHFDGCLNPTSLRRCLIIAGGEPGPIYPFSPPLSSSFPENPPPDYDLIIAADKGLEYALRMTPKMKHRDGSDASFSEKVKQRDGSDASFFQALPRLPDVVMGDFDSLDPSLAAAFAVLSGSPGSGDVTGLGDQSSGAPRILRLPARKNDSDTQSAVKYALEQGCQEITISCAMGGRLDHLLANLQTGAYAARRGALCRLIGRRDEVYVFSGGTLRFPRREGWSFSVLSLSDKSEGIRIDGALYTVADFIMTNELSRGLSNEWASEEIRVSVGRGVIAVILSKRDVRLGDGS